MSLIDSIKRRIGEYQLRQELPRMKREKAFTNIDDAKTFGIVFQYTNNDDMELLKKYVSYLRDLRKKVKCVGLFLEKELPSFPYSKLEFDFFNQKSLTSVGKPSDHILLNFIEEPFDVLIDCNLQNQFPLKYIVAASKSHFKVGRLNDKDRDLYDMMIDCGNEKSLKFFLRQVDTYLGKINKPAQG